MVLFFTIFKSLFFALFEFLLFFYIICVVSVEVQISTFSKPAWKLLQAGCVDNFDQLGCHLYCSSFLLLKQTFNLNLGKNLLWNQYYKSEESHISVVHFLFLVCVCVDSLCLYSEDTCLTGGPTRKEIIFVNNKVINTDIKDISLVLVFVSLVGFVNKMSDEVLVLLLLRLGYLHDWDSPAFTVFCFYLVWFS